MKLSQTQDYLLLIDEEAEININDYITDKYNVWKWKDDSSLLGRKKVLAYRPLTKEAKELDLPELPPFEGDVWVKGNRISVTTVYEYEERQDWPNHNEYKNLGYQTYVGEVIEVDKGLALKTDDGKIFKTQGTYWFGSILNQNCKLLEAAQSKQFSLEDIKEALKQFAVEAGSIDGAIDVSSPASAIKWINHYIQSLSTQQLPKEFIPSVKEISKYSYRDNSGNEYFTFKGLTRGDIIISNKNQEGIGGDFIPYPMTLIKKDKEYIIKDVSSFGFYTVPWIINEDGDHTIPNFDTFSIKNNEKFKTITNSEGKRELVGIYKY